MSDDNSDSEGSSQSERTGINPQAVIDNVANPQAQNSANPTPSGSEQDPTPPSPTLEQRCKYDDWLELQNSMNEADKLVQACSYNKDKTISKNGQFLLPVQNQFKDIMKYLNKLSDSYFATNKELAQVKKEKKDLLKVVNDLTSERDKQKN